MLCNCVHLFQDGWINKTKLINFILECQDSGLADPDQSSGAAPMAGSLPPPTPEQDASLCDPSCGGGIAERPGNMADIFHSFFGIAGLSLMEYFTKFNATPVQKFDYLPESYAQIDPTFALPCSILKDLHVTCEVAAPKGDKVTAGESGYPVQSSESSALADAIKSFLDQVPAL